MTTKDTKIFDSLINKFKKTKKNKNDFIEGEFVDIDDDDERRL